MQAEMTKPPINLAWRLFFFACFLKHLLPMAVQSHYTNVSPSVNGGSSGRRDTHSFISSSSVPACSTLHTWIKTQITLIWMFFLPVSVLTPYCQCAINPLSNLVDWIHRFCFCTPGEINRLQWIACHCRRLRHSLHPGRLRYLCISTPQDRNRAMMMPRRSSLAEQPAL